MEEKKQGKTLEICALVFGILSIVTCCCCFGFWGVIGLILAIVALAKGRKSGLTIAGLICSIVGVLGSLLIIVYLVFSPSGKIFRDEFNRNFKAGFQEGFESAYEGPDLGNVTEDFTESSDDVKAETNVEDDGNEQNSDNESEADDGDEQNHDNVFEAGKGYDVIKVGKTTVKMPSTLADLEKDFEIDYGNGIGEETAWETNESGTIRVCNKKGEVLFDLWKQTGTKLEDIKQEDVGSIYASGFDCESADKVEFFNGIRVGMKESDLKNALKDLNYDRDDSYETFTTYVVTFSDENSHLYMYLSVFDGAVKEVNYDYYVY